MTRKRAMTRQREMSTGHAITRRATQALAALAAGLVLTACAGSSDVASMTGSEAMAPAAEVMMADGAAVEAAPVPSAKAREVIRNGYITIRVTDVGASIADVHGLVTDAHGIIATEDRSVSDPATGRVDSATITAQVPAADLDAFIASVSGLGNVESLSLSAQDVTQQGVDLDARITALRASIDRMNDLLDQATRIEDLLAIETQISQRQAELDSLVAQRTWLSSQVAMSSVTVTLLPVTTIADVEVPGFLSGLESGWSALIAAAKISLTALGFFLPFLAIALVIGVPLAIWLVRRSRRRRAQPPVQPVTTPEDTSSVSRSGR